MSAVRRNHLDIVLLLVKNGARVAKTNNLKLNALDYAIVYCNYSLALYFLKNYSLILKSVEDYVSAVRALGAPCFNLNSFLDLLNSEVPSEEVSYRRNFKNFDINLFCLNENDKFTIKGFKHQHSLVED